MFGISQIKENYKQKRPCLTSHDEEFVRCVKNKLSTYGKVNISYEFNEDNFTKKMESMV